MTHKLSGKVLAFVRTQRVARVATVSGRGAPHNVPVCTVVTAGRIYFATEKDSRKARNLRANPRLALAFDEYSDNWKRLSGAMIAGTGVIIEHGAAFNRARQALYRKYKPYSRVSPIHEGESVIICVTPTSSFSWGL